MTAEARQEYTSEFLRLGPRTNGVLRSPTRRGPEASVGVIAMHPTSDFHNHLSGSELAARGFRTLCTNGRFVNQPEDRVITEELPLDVKHAVAYMRQQPGIDKVALVGHSGGGELMALYQHLAEKGPGAGQGPGKLVQATDELSGLPPADGLILLDAHPGGNRATYLDPAVRDEAHPELRDSSLDMYDPSNGYDPEGANYSEDFKRRFYQAQGERMNRLVGAALDRRAVIDAGRGSYPDTEPFAVARVGARMLQADLSQVRRTKNAYPVLKADGSQVVEVPQSVRLPSANREHNLSYSEGVVTYTVHSFLSWGALRAKADYCVTEDAIEGLGWDTTNVSTVANIPGIESPTLIMAMGAHYFIVPSEMYYTLSPSSDKTMVVVEGATHGFQPCKPSERFPGQFGDTVKTTFDYVGGWLRERFL